MAKTVSGNSSTTPVNDLKSPTAIMLNETVTKAQKEFSQIQAAIEDAKASGNDELLTQVLQDEKKTRKNLVDAITKRRDFLEGLKADLNEKLEIGVAATPAQVKKAKTDLSLVEAALSDLSSQLEELKRQDSGSRGTAKKKATIQKSKIEEGIEAVLQEASKAQSKTKKQSMEQEAIKVEEIKTTTNKETTEATSKVASKKPAAKAEKAKKGPFVNKYSKAAEEGRYSLKKHYQENVIPALIKEFGYKNVNQVPKIDKIIVNRGLGDAKDDSKKFSAAVEELALICGQKPIITKAKKSIANFKIRGGMNVGAKVTLRGNRMYEFLEKVITMALPRVRDFRGLNGNSFDGRGNYTFGIKEQLIFPEIKYDQVEKIRGFDVIIVTTAKTDEESKALLKAIGMPFGN